jgi:hypothetical protein
MTGVNKKMQIEELTCVPGKAKEELEALKIAIQKTAKNKNAETYRDLKRVYGHMQKYGGSVIDVVESITKAGLNADNDPKMAIVRADSRVVFCRKYIGGNCGFHHEIYWNPFGYNSQPRIIESKRPDVVIPSDSFKWTIKEGFENNRSDWAIKRATIQAPAPLIPAAILNLAQGNLKNYFVLWEVEKWQPIPPRDPMLLKQLTPNLYAVVATWDLTELERAIIKGRL